MFITTVFIAVVLVLNLVNGVPVKENDRAIRAVDDMCLYNLPMVGGNGGYTFSDWDAFMSSRKASITKFTIRHGSAVDCFGFKYGNIDGSCHGGNGGALTTVHFAPDEYIKEINGRGGTRVDKMSIVTNKHTYGPYGGNGGNYFKVPFYGKRLAFITGRANRRLDSMQLVFYC